MNQDQEILRLFEKYVAGSISKDEIEEMLSHFREYGFPEGLDQKLLAELRKTPDNNASAAAGDSPSRLAGQITDRVEIRLQEEINRLKTKTKPIKRWLPRVAAASAVLFVLAGAAWWFVNSSDSLADPELAANQAPQHVEIVPAGNRASLVLSDGRVIALDETRDGIVIDGRQITYGDGNSTVLDLSEQAAVEAITLTTPRGGTYRLTLPDGTQVWLNAASTLTYPSRFRPEERVVHLEGEAYFAVKQIEKDKKLLPFRVESSKQTIEVLGTEFNVSAYGDETQTRTTLINGKVSIQAVGAMESLMLSPGEQSLVDQQVMRKTKVNVNDYIDWKNGEFVFRNENTHQVMQRIGRWYDLDVKQLDQRIINERFSGTISRYGNLQTVLDIMSEAADLSFEIENRSVSVSKKVKK